MQGPNAAVRAGRMILLSCAMAALQPAVAKVGATAHGRAQVGLASWYGEENVDQPTASGTNFDPDEMTAAHRTLPLGSCARVTNLANRRSVVVTIRDRGPHVRTRLIDLSEAAAAAIGMKHKGIARVRLRALPACPSVQETDAH